MGLKNKKESISIHSLRVEGDFCGYQVFSGCVDISIHSLRVEGDMAKELCMIQRTISIHSLRVEGDRHEALKRQKKTSFQSTPSVWRETVHHIQHLEDTPISIHSLRVEGD